MALTGIVWADVVLPGVVTSGTVAFPGVVRWETCVGKEGVVALLRVVMGVVAGFPDVGVTLTGVIRVAVLTTTVVLPDVLKKVEVTFSPAVEDGIEAVPDVVTGGFVAVVGWFEAVPAVDTCGLMVLAAVVEYAGGVVA